MPARPGSVLGERARAARTKLGLNQSEVAERVGISNEVYGRLERGLMTPRLATFLRLCDVLDVEPNDLLLVTPEPQLRDEAGSPELRQLVAVLEDADALVLKRVTEVARWLLAGRPSRGEPPGPSKRAAKPPSDRRGPRRRGR
ncbi:MAG TPA: helix-turn-helix domain-containing protein [Kofleriaceae bacterium]|nr:helix-turn-helix domain-containing protein [Kofleriaceae bacterium]